MRISPYKSVAANLLENGYHPLPVMIGEKIPGIYQGDKWTPMPGWSKYCTQAPAPFVMDKWSDFPSAGVCIAHGKVIGLDVDTDRTDVHKAIASAAPPATVKRRGKKGYMAYYRPQGLDALGARLRWYDGETVACEILLHGTLSVLPPTIHPDTQKPYVWLTEDTLDNTDISDLPFLSVTDIDKIDAALSALGLSRKKERRVGQKDYERPCASAHDLEKPFGRSINDRAIEASAMDQWWPALDMPKSHQRGAGAWEAIPFWRPSGSGRPLMDRNPNLKSIPTGIVDFGANKSYTPVDVVMAARDCGFDAAAIYSP